MAGSVLLAVQLERQFAEHIEPDYNMTTAERTAYLGNPLRYAGQVVFDTDLSALFFLNNNLNGWIAIGGTPPIEDTDDVPEGATNKYFTEEKVRDTLLTGLTLATSAVISAADSVLGAFGKLQAQITTLVNRIQNSLTYDGTGNKIPTVDAVNNLSKSLAQVSTKTGLLSHKDNFNLLALDDNTARITAIDSVMFWDELFVGGTAPSSAIKVFPQKDYVLTQLITATGGNVNINPIVTDGKYVRYIGYDKDQNIYSSETSFVTNNSIFQIGFVTVLKVGASVTFLDGTAGPRNVFPQPTIASNTNFDKVSSTVTNVTISGNAAASFATKTGTITGISINWKSAVNPTNNSPIDIFPYTGQSTAAFRSINPLYLSGTALLGTHTLWTETEDGIAINSKFFNTTTQASGTMTNGSASIKRVLVGTRGGIYLQDGEHSSTACYADLATAKNNIFTHPFSEAIVPPGVAFEIARIAYVKGCTNLSDTSQVYIINTAGASSSSGTVAPISDATTISKGIIQLAGDLGGTAASPTVPALANKLNIAPTYTTGVALTFTTDTIYGSETTPETGNITASTAGAIVGVTNLIIHNSGTEPTFDSKFHKLSTSGAYVLGVKNYIYCQYLSSTRINYIIAQ